ncbi:MAG: ATP-binding protein [Thermodesulfobacteriota bacterium]
MIKLLNKLRPAFFDKRAHVPGLGESKYLFNYQKIWKLSILLTGVVALVPLIFITVLNYSFTGHAIESEWVLRTARTVSNTQRAISFFLQERKSALDFITHDNSVSELNNPSRLSDILETLKQSFGEGFVDLGLIDSNGRQTCYVGPYGLSEKDYSGQPWFKQVLKTGVHISDVFLGYRNVPHLVVAVKKNLPEGTFNVLRASIAIEPFEHLLSNLELGGMGDAFIINLEGILQTSSHYFGGVLQKVSLSVPHYSPTTQVIEVKTESNDPIFIGYRFIEETPFILMIVKQKNELMKQWNRTSLKLILFLLISMSFILAVIVGTVTYMVNRIYIADERRLITLHKVEYENKMASIGRLAASVAHEINNPLAIINENTGLIIDLFAMNKEYSEDAKLNKLLVSITKSVKRAGSITKRLLTFARNLQAEIEPVHIEEVVREVLSFLQKEAEHRSIDIRINVQQPYVPIIETDRGKLEQVFLNIINNAFAAMSDSGQLIVQITYDGRDNVEIRFQDNGYGIPKEYLDRIFEPFFSTKTRNGGTGLGLSITYNLINEIGGRIQVESEVNKGACFTITLPLKMPRQKEKN